jgi:hypothetical protein
MASTNCQATLCGGLDGAAIFLKPTVWFPVFVVVSVAVIVLLPKLAPWFFRRYGDRVIEPEIKLVFAGAVRVDGARRAG